MISSIIDAVLLTALAATSGSVLLMYRRLRQFDALQSDAARAFASSALALDKAKAALETLQGDGGDMAVSLAARLNEARLMINELERGAMRFEAESEPLNHPPTPAETIDAAWQDRFNGLMRQAAARQMPAEEPEYGYRGGMPVPRPPEPASPVAAAIEAALMRMSPSDAAEAARNPRWRAIAEAAHRAA